MSQEIECPFWCGFFGRSFYETNLHIQQEHTPDSPFVVRNDAPAHDDPRRHVDQQPASSIRAGDDSSEVTCLRDGCGDRMNVTDVEYHDAIHESIKAAEEDFRRAQLTPNRSQTYHYGRRDAEGRTQRPGTWRAQPSGQSRSDRGSVLDSMSNVSLGSSNATIRRHRRLPEPRHPGRLGRDALGPYAYERAMPDRVRRQLLEGARPRQVNRIDRHGRLRRELVIDNETAGLIPVLADICDYDQDTQAAYFCDASVRHITKISCEGNFCGFWNIQMLLAYMQQRNVRRDDQLMPNVLEIQDTIERAWDDNICPYGRVETGGIRGTRKYIGTHEAVAYFTYRRMPVEAQVYAAPRGEPTRHAAEELLDFVEGYYMSGLNSATAYGDSYVTTLPPIYFQRSGHSTTIVGLERRVDGSRNLLVFDPSMAPSNAVLRLLARKSAYSPPGTLLNPYRRSDEYLARETEFEIMIPQVTT